MAAVERWWWCVMLLLLLVMVLWLSFCPVSLHALVEFLIRDGLFLKGILPLNEEPERIGKLKTTIPFISDCLTSKMFHHVYFHDYL